MLTKRAQILFDHQMWQKLSALAKEHNTSIGELVRTAVQRHYSENEKHERIEKAVDAILAFRKKHGKRLAKGEDSTTLIRKMREKHYGKDHLRRLGSY